MENVVTRSQKIKGLLLILVVTLAIVLITLVIIAGYWVDWTGFDFYITPQVQDNQQYQREKTLWDWMNLLIIPAVLAGGGFLFNRAERESERSLAEKRAQNDQKIAADGLEEGTLQGYLDRMTELLLDKALRSSGVDTEVRAVARARTLTSLRKLNEIRKSILVQFLYDADLINIKTATDKPIIDLSGADLDGIDLRNTRLPRITLSGLYMRKSDLSMAILDGADVSQSDLSESKLQASFVGSDLSMSFLNNSDLKGANLSGSTLVETNFTNADITMVLFNNANLTGANLTGANLTGANLTGANLTGANLTRTVLTEVIGIEKQSTQTL
jgi:uncharacterized protein YjbI with pentapeptide repeats